MKRFTAFTNVRFDERKISQTARDALEVVGEIPEATTARLPGETKVESLANLIRVLASTGRGDELLAGVPAAFQYVGDMVLALPAMEQNADVVILLDAAAAAFSAEFSAGSDVLCWLILSAPDLAEEIACDSLAISDAFEAPQELEYQE